MPRPVRLTLSGLVPPIEGYAHFDGCATPENRFRADAEGLEWINAWWLAEASLLAYAPEAFAREAFAAAGLEAELLDHDGTQLYVAHDDRVVIAAFRGTQALRPGLPFRETVRETLRDLHADLQVRLEPWDGERCVHAGFRHALEAVWAPLRKRLRTLAPRRRVWLTGHSLGGAVATLAADRLGPRARGLFTFGAPRVGDAAFRDGFRLARAWRVVHHNDLVARVPVFARSPRSGLLPDRFAHAGRLVYLDHAGAWRPDATEGGDGLRERIRRRFAHLAEGDAAGAVPWLVRLAGDDLVDHAPYLYAVHAWNNLERARAAVVPLPPLPAPDPVPAGGPA